MRTDARALLRYVIATLIARHAPVGNRISGTGTQRQVQKNRCMLTQQAGRFDIAAKTHVLSEQVLINHVRKTASVKYHQTRLYSCYER